jgi:hypothetical protein
MKPLLVSFIFIFLTVSLVNASTDTVKVKTFTKKEIKKLAPVYINNNVNIQDPVIVDVDLDGDFDILNFTLKGNVEYYKNTGTLERPFFVLEDEDYEKYDISTFIPKSLILPIFFADRDGDNDVDLFAMVKEGYNVNTFQQQYQAMYTENTLSLDHGTLITIILVLVIIVLVLAIL